MKFFRKDNQELVVIVLRFAVGAVFVWFGIDKWVHPEAWYAWVPPFVAERLPMSLDVFMLLNGVFEFAVGALLVAGKLLRPASAAAGAFLVGVSLVLGANEVTVRDAALIGCCLALFIHADAKAAKPVSPRTLSLLCSLYVVFLFVYGLLYLRSS